MGIDEVAVLVGRPREGVVAVPEVQWRPDDTEQRAVRLPAHHPAAGGRVVTVRYARRADGTEEYDYG